MASVRTIPAQYSPVGSARSSEQCPVSLMRIPKPETATCPIGFLRHLFVLGISLDRFLCWPKPELPRRHWQPSNPPYHDPEQTPRQMTLRQEQPIIAGMFNQPPARLHQPLLQAGQ